MEPESRIFEDGCRTDAFDWFRKELSRYMQRMSEEEEDLMPSLEEDAKAFLELFTVELAWRPEKAKARQSTPKGSSMSSKFSIL